MIKFQERQPVKFSKSDDFSGYCLNITKFCPFLAPAEQNSVLFTSRYSLDGETLEDLQESMFYISIVEIERFRTRRAEYTGNSILLYCENAIFQLPEKFNAIDGEKLFGWPHYLLKLLYTEAGIMLGKFWINEEDTSRKGLSIPSPPCHFLSIRSAVKKQDVDFLSNTQSLATILLESEDNGQNIHKLLPEGCDTGLAESMRKQQYYQRVLNWGKRKVE